MNARAWQPARRAVWAALRTPGVRWLLLALVFVLPAVFLASGPEKRDVLSSAIGDRGYRLVSWELRNFLDKWTHELTSLFGIGDRTEEQRLLEVREYFRLSAEIAVLDREIERAASTGLGDLSGSVLARDELDSRRSDLQADVEKTIEGQVSKVLSELGLSWNLPFGGSDGYLFPPVDFRFGDSPRLLAVSPRERIELVATRLLEPGIGLEDAQDIEDGIEQGGELSALVAGPGGVATFPSVISRSQSIRRTLRIVAHEWVHHYMVFFPLGRSYWKTVDMTTINETIANVIGDEVGAIVYETYYAELMPEPIDSGGHAAEGDPFDYVMEMRKTRIRADGLLAQGKIDEAEQYLEERRLFLQENGYYFRRLNQAWFAFHGTYADDHSVVSPIGGQVAAVRGRSNTIKEFIEMVSGLGSHKELLKLLAE